MQNVNFLSPLRMCLIGLAAIALAALLGSVPGFAAQAPKPAPEGPSAQPAAPEDALGRTTPRGTVLGFLAAARKGNFATAAEYLNTRKRGNAAARLAEQLAFVLDRRLPARLNELSNAPEGSQSAAVPLGQELVGIINTTDGTVNIVLERANRKSGYVWLFSTATLAAVPDLHDEVNAIAVETILPEILLHRVLGVTVYALLFFFVGLPLLYVLLSLLNRFLAVIAGWALRHIQKKPTSKNPTLLPHPLRLLFIAFAIRWSLTKVDLPLLSRQFWASLSTLTAIVAGIWLFMLLSRKCENHVKRQLARRGSTGTAALVRPARRVIDVLAAFVGLLLALYAFGVNPTAALAGLGVGGIAVALAAQKTLENLIGGASIIMDKAIRAGDFLKVGDIQGTVEEIGLRSTRVRTIDRTVVSVPNGQMASMTLENFSFRDWCWFHHVIGLRYETTSAELLSLLDDIRKLLTQDLQIVVPDSARVRLLGFGQSGFNVDVSAYMLARDWPQFLEIQENLLLRIMELVRAKGAQIARPSQIVYLAEATATGTEEPLRKAVPSGS